MRSYTRTMALRAGAFTLIEMLVSLAILSLALTIVGVVFTVTTKTATQSAALSEVQTWTRQWATQIADDLRFIETNESVLVLAGRTVPAALTQEQLVGGRFYRVLVGDPNKLPSGYDPRFDQDVDPDGAYSDPRADIMMFLTKRPGISAAPLIDTSAHSNPDEVAKQAAYSAGGSFTPSLVAYGHAALGDATFDSASGKWQFPSDDQLRHIELRYASGDLRSMLPANRWHLSRRATIIDYVAQSSNDLAAGRNSLDKLFFTSSNSDDPTFGSEWKRISRCQPDVRGDQSYFAGDVARLNLPALLGRLGQGLAGNPGESSNWYAPLQRPYDFPKDLARGTAVAPETEEAIRNLLYVDGNPKYHHIATVLNDPPADLASNLGNQCLPGCVWFQVEFLMPEDPRNSLDYDIPRNRDTNVPVNPVTTSTRFDPPRWISCEPNKTYVFSPDTVENRALVIEEGLEPTTGKGDQDTKFGNARVGSRLADFARLDEADLLNKNPPKNNMSGALGSWNRRVRMWPYAVRVTVRVLDPRGRLQEPIMRTIIHRFE